MAAPLSPEEAVKLAEAELKEPNLVPFFGFFNLDGDSLGDEVSQAFVAEGLLSEDGNPQTRLAQLFQQLATKKTFENKLRQLIIPNFIKNLIAEKLGQADLSIVENNHLIVRGICEKVAAEIGQFFEKEPLPENDFLSQPYANQLAGKIGQIINNWLPDKTGFLNLLKFLLEKQYQNQKVIAPITEKLVAEIETALKLITILEIANKLSFYASVVLVENRLVIDLNFYDLMKDAPQVETIERYQLEATTLNDRLQEYDQENGDFETILQTAIDLNERV